MRAAAAQTPPTAAWPRQVVPYGDQHLPPEVATLLHAGLLRREWFVYVGRSVESLGAGGSTVVRIPISEEAHFEWVQTMSDTRGSGEFRVSVGLELPWAGGREEVAVAFTTDLVAWESLSGTGAEPHWHPPLFCPAGSTIVFGVQDNGSGSRFNTYVSGCRLVR